MITLLLGVWILAGLNSDFMAHRSGVQEPILTSSHLVMFSGIFATAGWILWGIGSGRSGRRGLAAAPAGYDLGRLAVALFLATLILDQLWHWAFGFEENIKALLSPSHALFFVGLMLLFSSPFRAAWAGARDLDSPRPSLQAFLPITLSIALTVLTVAFTFMYLWPFFLDQQIYDATLRQVINTLPPPAGAGALVVEDVITRRLLADIFLGNLILLAPLFLMLRRWRLPVGTATIYLFITTVSADVPTALAAGVVTDGLIWLLRPSSHRLGALRLFATLVPVVGGVCTSSAYGFRKDWHCRLRCGSGPPFGPGSAAWLSAL